jgi:hypothetical protein
MENNFNLIKIQNIDSKISTKCSREKIFTELIEKITNKI